MYNNENIPPTAHVQKLNQIAQVTNPESQDRHLTWNTYQFPNPSPILVIELRHMVWLWDKARLVFAMWKATGGVWCCQGLMTNQRMDDHARLSQTLILGLNE